MTPKVHFYLLVFPWFVMLAIGLSFERPEFRPYELVLRGGTHFQSNRRLEMDAYGALAYRYHTPNDRHVVHNVFTTDRSGFRNPTLTAPPDFVVVGDSFVVGVGVSDEQTLPSRLGHHLQTVVYNFGTQRDAGPPMFLADPRFARSPPKVVLFMPSAGNMMPIVMPERIDPNAPPPPVSPPPPPPTAVDRAVAKWRRMGRPIKRWLSNISRDNGLKKRAQRDYHAARRAVFGFPERIEVDGAPALVLSVEQQLLNQTAEERKVDEVVQTWLAFHRALEERGTKLVIIPLPESGDLYLDRFDEASRAKVVSPKFLDVVLARSAAAGLVVHDLRPLLEANKTPYLFLRDDTHYAPRTLELIAAEVAQLVRSMEP